MANHADVSYGLNLIEAERISQVRDKPWTITNDDTYVDGQLKTYARYWLTHDWDTGARAAMRDILVGKHNWDPRAFDYESKTAEQRLTIAGALIAAELDRQHRASL